MKPVDLVLFLRALGLVHRAQRVRHVPVPEVVAEIVSGGWGGRGHPVPRLELATARAVTRWRRWFGGLDTCLIRSLVLGGLLTGQGDVRLNIGFRPGEEKTALDGHAWVTVDGSAVGPDGNLEGGRYTRVLTVPFSVDSGDK